MPKEIINEKGEMHLEFTKEEQLRSYYDDCINAAGDYDWEEYFAAQEKIDTLLKENPELQKLIDEWDESYTKLEKELSAPKKTKAEIESIEYSNDQSTFRF